MCKRILSHCVCVVGLLLITTTTRTPAAPVAAYGGGVLHVDDDAPPGGDGASWETPYRFLHDALLTAGKGDVGEIRVAQGIYKPDRDEANPDGTGDRDATFQLISGVALMGGYAGLGEPDPDERDIELYVTVLSGDLLGNDEPDFVNYEENSYTVVTGSSTDSTAVLDGCTITAGNACCTEVDFDPRHLGGGMYNENGSPTLQYCRFVANRAGNDEEFGWGGGIYNRWSSPAISDCLFSNNLAKAGGGAIRNNQGSSPVITSSVFVDNVGDFGAGIAYRSFKEPSNVFLDHCLFVNNLATGPGGGIHVREAGNDVLIHCVFSGNASIGGGAALLGVSAGLIGISNCVFTDNDGGIVGGGLAIGTSAISLTDSFIAGNVASFIGGGIFTVGESTLINCAFSGNTATMGGGLQNGGIATLINCTFGNNAGNGVENDPTLSAALANCVLWGNTPAQLEGGSFTVTYSDIQDGWPGAGNIDADPLFAQPGADDLRLGFGSPCIDAGDNDAVPDGITTDLDGLPRFVDDPDVDDTGHGTPPIVDMGAYEGGNAFNDPTDSEEDLDQGETVILIPNGGSFDPFFNAAVIVTNASGPDDAMFAVTQIDWDLHPGAAGFSELGFILRTETTLKPGQFLMRLFIPFEAEQLQGKDHALLDVTSFDDPSGNWVLAVLPNTQDSPDRHGPIGDKFVDDNPDDGWDVTQELGDWGVVYDPDLERGFVWANADYSDDLGFGVPICPADCSPFGGDGLVSSLDLLGVLSGWGLEGASGPCDLDRDDDVDAVDLTFLLQSWGSCPEPAYAPPAGPAFAIAEANRAVLLQARVRAMSDLDGNGVVDRLDLQRLQANWGACDNCPTDLDADGVVGSRDLLILLANWGYSEL